MKNLFINKTANADKFGKMVDRIGEISEVDKKFIRKSCERVINEWEERNKKDFSTYLQSFFSFFFGSRRIGKTYLFFQIMKELIDKNNISKDQIVYLNFKHPFKFHSI